jgi:hypothetical protein
VALFAPVKEIRRRYGSESSVGKLPFPKHQQAVGFGIWKRLQEHAIYDGEDGGVGADTQCQGQDRNRGEGAILRQGPKSVAKILQEGVDGNPISNVANALLDLFHAIEFPARLKESFFAWQAAAFLLDRHKFEIAADFFVQLTLDAFPAEDVSTEFVEAPDHNHPPHVARKALAMASEIRSQRSDSVCSWLLPALVNR